MPITGGLGIRALATRLGRIDAELQAELRPALEEVGQLVGGRTEELASFSSKLPGQVFHKPAFGATGGGEIVGFHEGVYPHVAEARVMEGDGSDGSFRHPVYDQGGWAEQERHPSLHPALDEEHAKAVGIIKAAVLKAMTI